MLLCPGLDIGVAPDHHEVRIVVHERVIVVLQLLIVVAGLYVVMVAIHAKGTFEQGL